MSKQSIAEFIGEKIGNYDQDKSNRIGDVDIIVGKSNSERSRIKDQTIGESYIKSGLGFPVLGLFGLNSMPRKHRQNFKRPKKQYF